MIRAFSFASTPQLYFGERKLSILASALKTFGTKVLLVTGARSFMSSSTGRDLPGQLRDEGFICERFAVTKEPTPGIVDAAVEQFSDFAPDCVVAIGGGSALDAGKAISAMLPLKASVKEYLEGIGSMTHPGRKVPFIAVPTTSGTGSEATKNAVISEVGQDGYKRSLRHNNFVPNIAIIDPSLTLECPGHTTAASGMDAFTQLLESYLSTASNPMTDSLALEGLHRVSRSLLRVYRDGSNLDARTDMALASYLSGITLANAGLGLVHGFASPIGGYFDIPHGVVCSTLMAPSNRATVQKLRAGNVNPEALKKYAAVGEIFSHERHHSDEYYTDHLLDLIESWTEEMRIPRLSQYGISEKHFQKIVDKTDGKNNPIKLEKEDMIAVLESAIRNRES